MLETFIRRWKLQRLIADWCQFRDLVFQMMDGRGGGAGAQRKFLSAKARVASRLPVVLELKTSPLQQENQRHVEMMTDLLNRYRTLTPEVPPNARDRAEFEDAWHQHFIFLNKLKGVSAPKQRPAQSRRAFVPTGIPSPRLHRRHVGVGLFGLLIRVGVFAIFLYVIGKAIGLRWEAGRIIALPPTSVAGVGRNALDGLQSIWGGVTHFVDPVTLAYGPTASIVLVGLLLLGIGYLVFVRG